MSRSPSLFTRHSVSPLYALTSDSGDEQTLRREVRELVDAGVRWIQVREKRFADSVLYSVVAELTRELAESGVALIVNDRADIALSTSTAGVHLGDRDVPPRRVRELAGDIPLIIGRSTHSLEEGVEVAGDPAVDYVAIGPIFESRTKMVRPPHGTEIIRELRRRVEKPIVAIGGITPANARAVLEAGADAVAVSGSLYDGGAIGENVSRFLEAIEPRS